MAQFEGGQMLPINHEGFNILHQEWVCIGIFPTSKILKPLLFLRFVLLLKCLYLYIGWLCTIKLAYCII